MEFEYKIENVLNGEHEDEWLYFVMPLDSYLEYDDGDLYE